MATSPQVAPGPVQRKRRKSQRSSSGAKKLKANAEASPAGLEPPTKPPSGSATGRPRRAHNSNYGETRNGVPCSLAPLARGKMSRRIVSEATVTAVGTTAATTTVTPVCDTPAKVSSDSDAGGLSHFVCHTGSVKHAVQGPMNLLTPAVVPCDASSTDSAATTGFSGGGEKCLAGSEQQGVPACPTTPCLINLAEMGTAMTDAVAADDATAGRSNTNTAAANATAGLPDADTAPARGAEQPISDDGFFFGQHVAAPASTATVPDTPNPKNPFVVPFVVGSFPGNVTPALASPEVGAAAGVATSNQDKVVISGIDRWPTDACTVTPLPGKGPAPGSRFLAPWKGDAASSGIKATSALSLSTQVSKFANKSKNMTLPRC